MTPITIKGTARTEKVNCPSCFEEMKVRHYQKMIREWEDGSDIAGRDYYHLFNILTDNKVTGFQRNVDNDATLINLVGWVIVQPFDYEKNIPRVLHINGKNIPIPEDPRELSIGQNIHLRRDYIDKSTKLEENIAIATAIYLQPLIDNSLFNIKRAVEISKEIEEMPINLIYPIGFFLLERALRFGTRQEKTWLLEKISLRKMLKKMWRDWLR